MASKKEPNIDSDDYYELMGLDKKASEADIKKAYRLLAIRWHPVSHYFTIHYVKKVCQFWSFADN